MIDGVEQADGPVYIPAEDGHGGEIIARTHASRLIFLVGLVDVVVLAMLIQFIVAH